MRWWGRWDSNPHALRHMILNRSDIEPQILVNQFIQGRSQGLSPHTIAYYRQVLTRAKEIAQPFVTPPQINAHLGALGGSLGNQHAHFRVLRVFFRWLYSPRSGIEGLVPHENPMQFVDPPKVPKRILPSLTLEQVEHLISTVESARDKAIIALLTESGLRVSELTAIRPTDINWSQRTIRIVGKGNKEGLAPFGAKSQSLLSDWIDEYQPDTNAAIWDVTARGVQHMLNDLSKKTGLQCNPHTFRRTFACLLRKAGVDMLTIKELGRWESVEMVERYTRSFTFEDSLRFYNGPLSSGE